MFKFFKRADTVENQPPTPPQPGETSAASPAPAPDTDLPRAEEASPASTSPSEDTAPLDRSPAETSAAETHPPVSEVKSVPEPLESALPASKPLYPPLPLQKPRRNLLSSVFSPETALGRFIRPFLRGLAAITGFFALGLLAGYILIYQPTQRELDAALLKIKQTNQSISQKDQTLQSVQSNSDQAQQSLKQVQTQLNKAASENGLLVVLVGVGNARISLVNKDGPAAKAAIEQAQIDLAAIFPYISSVDQNKADLLKSRLDLAAKELVSDPPAALTDLDKLSADLTDLHKKIFK